MCEVSVRVCVCEVSVYLCARVSECVSKWKHLSNAFHHLSVFQSILQAGDFI